jgi:multidrug efflux pump subunit AcrA (membrane-fusion protein)
LALAQTEEVVTAPGKLEPIGDVKTIQVPVGGVLETMLVKDGERVKKGQVLLRLDNEATKDREQGLVRPLRQSRSNSNSRLSNCSDISALTTPSRLSSGRILSWKVKSWIG